MKRESPRIEPSLPTDADEQLVELLDGYVGALERGDAEPIDTIVARHPEHGQELAECLEGVRAIHAAVQAAREQDGAVAAEDPTVDTLGSEDPAEPSGDRPTKPRSLGGYDIVREIGRGGMGVVYEAVEQSLRRRVALKVLPFAAVLDQRQIARFRNEAQAAAALHHPHIVPVFSIGQERGVHFYAMPYVEGQSLAQAIAELRRVESGGAPPRRASPTATTIAGPLLDAEEADVSASDVEPPVCSTPSLRKTGRAADFFRVAARLAADAADALQHAHDQGIVHRDIKPSNLLLDEQGKVWVTDFGLARVQADLGVTATGDVVGTLRYMSPEQASGRADRVDGRTDVYALGATLYELLTLRQAHRGEDRAAMLRQLESGEPIPPRRLDPSIPADLENIVLRAMEKDRDGRYPTAGELRDDLVRFLEGRPTIARPPNLAQRAGKWVRRRRRLVGFAAAACMAIATTGAVSGLFVERARQRTEAALAESERHRARAERLLDKARGVLDRLGADVSDRLAALPGSEPIRRRVLEDTLAYYRDFLDESRGDPRLAASAAQTRVRAAAAAERLDQPEEALALYEEAEEVLTGLLEDRPEDPVLVDWLARCLINRGLLLNETEEAQHALDRAVALRRGLLRDEPRSARRMADLAATLSDRATLPGKSEKAGPNEEAGQNEQAAGLTEAIALFERAVEAEPDAAAHRRRLAMAHNKLATLWRTEKPAEARSENELAVAQLSELVAAEPVIDAYRADLAMCLSTRGALAADRGDGEAAARAYGAAADELDGLARRNPQLPRHRSERAIALASRGFALASVGERGRAERALRAAEETLAGLIADYPHEAKYRRSQAALWNNRGVVLRDAGRLEEAAVAFAHSVRLEEERLARTTRPSPTLLAIHYANQAQVLGRLGRFDEAAQVETKRVAFVERAKGERASASNGGGEP